MHKRRRTKANERKYLLKRLDRNRKVGYCPRQVLYEYPKLFQNQFRNIISTKSGMICDRIVSTRSCRLELPLMLGWLRSPMPPISLFPIAWSGVDFAHGALLVLRVVFFFQSWNNEPFPGLFQFCLEARGCCIGLRAHIATSRDTSLHL